MGGEGEPMWVGEGGMSLEAHTITEASYVY